MLGCAQEHKRDGPALAHVYCGSCHLFPEPSLLDSATWLNRVLPSMAEKLGLRYFNGEVYENIQSSSKNANLPSAQNPITPQEWKLIESYYHSHSPANNPQQQRQPISSFTRQFKVIPGEIANGSFPTTTFLRIDPGNHWIIAGQGYDSSLLIYGKDLRLIKSFPEHGIIVDAWWESGLKAGGERNAMLLNIGNMNPNDEKLGSIRHFSIGPAVTAKFDTLLANQLPRPVQVTGVDLDKDGKPDWLICGFGNKEGELFWLKNESDGRFTKKILLSMPGAIKAYIRDWNGDGRPDIWVLMAQAEEGIYLLTNQGNGNFTAKEILRFPPVYGSSYFEMDDFNGDGYPDILYTCGDNADFTAGILKNFHGLYVFLNDGSNNFKQKYFFPIHGCYKAIAGDFDGDGDLDIATISYFPDIRNQPQEGFVYLENMGNWNFNPSTIPEAEQGKWLTMDAGDLDGDGDEDLVIGSLAVTNKSGKAAKDTSSMYRYPFFLLDNQAIRKRP